MDEYLYLKLLTLYRNLQLTRKWILHASDKTGHNLKIQITFEMNTSMLKKIQHKKSLRLCQRADNIKITFNIYDIDTIDLLF